MSNGLLDHVVQSSVATKLMAIIERVIEQRAGILHVLTYHRVLDGQHFAEQMAFLSEEYNVISSSDLLQAIREQRLLPPGALVITFDDAYQDFAGCAWPIMKRYGFPVTLFVPTAFPDDPERIFWWDRLQHALEHTSRRDTLETPAGQLSLSTPTRRQKAYRKIRDHIKKLPYSELLFWTHKICSELDAPPAPHRVLGWNALRELANEGVTLAPHTRYHRFLDQLTAEEVEEEVVGSMQDIKREIGSAPPIFAYPDGRFNRTVIKILKDAGFIAAFTTIKGANDMQSTDRMQLRRINIGPYATVHDLRARILKATLPPNGRRQ